jgi:putative SOS response-associated peptidase YedK
MPVTVPPALFADWLDSSAPEPRDLNSIVQAAQAAPWTAEPISARVNSPKNDDAACITPLALR